jgi:hypothetical protein
MDAVAADTPNVFVVDVDDQLLNDDALHLPSSSQQELGDRVAAVVIANPFPVSEVPVYTRTTLDRNRACDDDTAEMSYVEIQDSGDVVLATFTFEGFEAAGTGTAGEARAFGDDAATIATTANPLIATSVAAGTADHYVVYNVGTNALGEGSITVTGGGGDVTVASLTVPNDRVLHLTSFKHTVPAS